MSDYSKDFETAKGKSLLVSECDEEDDCVVIGLFAANVAGAIMRIAKKMEQRKRGQ